MKINKNMKKTIANLIRQFIFTLEDEQPSPLPNIRTNEQFRTISPKDHLDQSRSESVRIYDQNRPSDQLVRSSGPTPPRSRSMQQGQDQDPRLGVGKELTIEDIQLAAR